MKIKSLRIRLILSFILVSSVIWLTAGILSWKENREQLDEFFDTYQLLLGRQLATADWQNLRSDAQKKTDRLIEDLDDDGDEEDEALGFAVFDNQGNMIFNDNENGKRFPYNSFVSGFIDQPIGRKGDMWRIVWLKSADGQYTIAVGQEIEYRDDAALEIVEETLLPWLAGLTALMLATFWLVSSGLRSLKKISGELSAREPDDLSGLKTENIPLEVAPLVKSLNGLFVRLEKMLQKERSFISDSAHELRSPLTALKVQLEVAMLSENDPETLKKALSNLHQGIERSERLVEQLLALSRLEAASSGYAEEKNPLDWKALTDKAAEEQKEAADRKNITIATALADGTAPFAEGNALLCSLLLRNLLDNAVKYSPDGAEISVSLGSGELCVFNGGARVEEEYLRRLSERFFRPPGQKESGSGLGLSIVKRIAEIHGCGVCFENTDGGFRVVVRRKA